MKIIAASVLMTVLTLGHAQAQSEIKEQMVVPLSEPGKACKVVAHVLHGSLKVVGYDGKEVVINVTTDASHRKESSGNNGGMHRISGSTSGGDITAEEDNNTVNINTGLSHFSLIEVKVPQSAGGKLNLSTVNEGSIVVENTSGEMEVSNVNGPITLTNVAGSVVANTVNGDVVVGFKTVDPQAAMAFSTLNGKIDVTFPAGYKANAKLKAQRGDIFSDFDVEITKDQPSVNKSTEGHMYRINIDEWVYGKINGGGPELMMKTSFGSIFIRKAK
jgi:DUF4097 and DUF4098 domain-containing protein YvlB